ncbi:MAG: L-threonine 3-dehydrogenase [Myxococcota bacterium]
MNRTPKILVTGALGQIGSELIRELVKKYGKNNVLASDIKKPSSPIEGVDFVQLDCLDFQAVKKTVDSHQINRIYHLAALLSAIAEANPQKAWKVNMDGLFNILETARELDCSVFTPSSIGAFGPSTPPDQTPQVTIQRPTSIYGVTKVAGELLCDYYHKKFGTDTRGVRYPGIISNLTPPGGGTTDYAVDIYYEAVKKGHYTCFLKPDTNLDMMYMPDAISAAIELMEADPDKLVHRNAFNVTAMSFTPREIRKSIQKYMPEFSMDYEVDPVRQAIADSWPNSMDDSAAKEEWSWNPDYDLDAMTQDMLTTLKKRL